MNRWETEFWSLLSPDTARRLKAELGMTARPHSFLSGVELDAEAPPAVGSTPDAGGAVLTRQQLDQIFDILRDIEVMLDEKADADNDIPADDMQMLMRLLVGVRDVIRKLEGR